MKGLTDLKRRLLQEILYAIEPEHTPGMPYTNEELNALAELWDERRIDAYRCACGDMHPTPTVAGREALMLDSLSKMPMTVC